MSGRARSRSRSASMAAVVRGGNSDAAARAAKRNRYGREQWKIRYPTHYQFCLRLLTYTTDQGFDNNDDPPAGFPAIPTANVECEELYDVGPEGAPQPFYSLNPRVPASATNGTLTLNSCGLYGVWSEELPTATCPWLTTYFSFKLDGQGFNLCDPEQFAKGCEQYEYIKQGPYCATFVWPDPPISKGAGPRRYLPLTQPTFNGTTGTLSAYGAATIEERSVGAWEMILIPPRNKKSVNLCSTVGQDNWDRLIDMGFKPRPTQKVVKIYCSNTGIDMESLESVVAQQQQLVLRDFNDPTAKNLSDLKLYKARYMDTEDVCQYYKQTTVQSFPEVPQAVTWYPETTTMKAQGFPAVPFGSAVAFRFRQFAPVQTNITQVEGQSVATNTQTCIRQTIPLDIYLDSVTTFKSPVKGEFDLDLPFTDPSVVPAFP